MFMTGVLCTVCGARVYFNIQSHFTKKYSAHLLTFNPEHTCYRQNFDASSHIGTWNLQNTRLYPVYFVTTPSFEAVYCFI